MLPIRLRQEVAALVHLLPPEMLVHQELLDLMVEEVRLGQTSPPTALMALGEIVVEMHMEAARMQAIKQLVVGAALVQQAQMLVLVEPLHLELFVQQLAVTVARQVPAVRVEQVAEGI